MNLQFKPLGDQGVQISFGQEISAKISMAIQSFQRLLLQQKELPIYESVPAFTTLSVYYDPTCRSYHTIIKELSALAQELTNLDQHQPYIFEIPTVYGGVWGPDLADVATYNQLQTTEVIQIHTEQPYLIHMLGFMPGFPYLGGMSGRIATPRLANPRPKVAAGSVGIAGAQTGIYPLESPGGWRIIGRTPVPLYRPQHDQPFLLQAGHYIKFVSIDPATFNDLQEKWATEQNVTLNSYPYDET